VQEFKGFGLTEKPDAPLSYTFTMTRSADEEYKLKVYWSQLADQSHTPERTKKRLVADDVAGRMRGKSQGEYFTWRNVFEAKDEQKTEDKFIRPVLNALGWI
jgi:hypothetical protein